MKWPGTSCILFPDKPIRVYANIVPIMIENIMMIIFRHGLSGWRLAVDWTTGGIKASRFGF
jgi:hypothetical protein